MDGSRITERIDGVVTSISRRKLSVPGAAVQCLIGTWLLSVVTQGFIIVPASILPQIAADLSVSQSRAVWLISATPGAWALSNFAVGFILTRRSTVWVTTAATAGFVAMVLAGWWAATGSSFTVLLLTRIGAGICIGAIWTASADIVGHAFDAGNAGTALGIFTTSAPAGFALAQVGTPMVANAGGWPTTFLFVVGLTIVAYLLFLLGLRATTIEAPTADTTFRGDLTTVLSNRVVIMGCLMAFSAYSLYLFLNSWMPTYLQEQFSISVQLSGLLAALFPAVGILSRAGGGIVSDRLFSRRRLPILMLSFAIAIPAIVLIALLQDVLLLVVILVIAGAVIQLTFGIVYSYVREGVDSSLSGTALSVLGTAGMSGAFSAPLIAGALIDTTDAYMTAFLFAGIIGVAGLALSLIAPEISR